MRVYQSQCLRGALAPAEAPDVPDEPLGGQLPSLQAFVLMHACVCACVLESHAYEVKMKGASQTAPSSYKQYVAVYVAMQAAALSDLIKASEQHAA